MKIFQPCILQVQTVVGLIFLCLENERLEITMIINVIQYRVSVMLILFNFPIESTCWTSYDMNVLVSIKSGKQLSMSANFGMFVSLAIKKIIVNEYQLRYACFLWKWQ